MSQKLSSKKKYLVYDYDYQLKNIFALLKKELSENNLKLVTKYDIAMVNASLAKATRHKNLKMILSLTRLLQKDWIDVTAHDIEALVFHIMTRYGNQTGQETNTTHDHKKTLKIFFRWIRLGSREKNEVGDPPETKNVKIKKVKDKIVREDLLCQPGKISVIDVNGLDIPRRRFVAVNLLQLLHRYKEKQEHLYPGIILVMDEAEQLFPIKCSKSEKAHVDRIITKTKEIADNGRKRHFGQFICTHLSGSIDERVVGLAETIMAFRCSGDEKWIRKEFGKGYVDVINSLKTGECMIKVKISEEDQKQILAKIYFPDVSLQN